MQHSCGVPYSIALSYQFQNATFCKHIEITLTIILYEFIVSKVGYRGILSNYSLENHKLGNYESFNNFSNGTDTSIIVRLICPSYCQFYMHIISIIVFYMLYSRIYK